MWWSRIPPALASHGLEHAQSRPSRFSPASSSSKRQSYQKHKIQTGTTMQKVIHSLPIQRRTKDSSCASGCPGSGSSPLPFGLVPQAPDHTHSSCTHRATPTGHWPLSFCPGYPHILIVMKYQRSVVLSSLYHQIFRGQFRHHLLQEVIAPPLNL